MSEKTEVLRRTAAYQFALDSLSVVSPRKLGGCEEYATIVCITLQSTINQLLTLTRRRERFARFRAQARAIDGMAKFVAYETEQEKLRKTKLYGTAKRQLKQELFKQ